MSYRRSLIVACLLIGCGPQSSQDSDPDPTTGTTAEPGTTTAEPTTTADPTTTTDPTTTDDPVPTTGPAPAACDEIALDPTLRGTVLSALSLPEDTVLTAEHALAVTSLSNTNNFGPPVQSLAGLECFLNLSKLRIDDSTVTDLAPLAALPLTVLIIASSAVTDLSPLAGAPTLELLQINAAPLSDLGPIAGMPALVSLGVFDTPVADFAPLAGHPTLKSIGASSTLPEDLAPLATIPTLTDLILNDCGITSIAGLAGAPALTELSLLDNAITDLAGLESLKTLQILDLSNNQISDLTAIGALDQLISLQLSDNQISDLAPLADAAQLHSLTLTGNPLTGLAGLEGLPLSFLVADKTGLTAIAAIAPETLDFLFLADNAITDLTPLAGHLVLRSLNIENNGVTTLAPIEKAAWLATGCPSLALTGNPLDADTLGTVIPSLCATEHVDLTWDQGECHAMKMQCPGF